MPCVCSKGRNPNPNAHLVQPQVVGPERSQVDRDSSMTCKVRVECESAL